jgi:hypothetical protein
VRLLQYSSVILLCAGFCGLAHPAEASEPEPGKIDSHASDNYVDLEAWGRSNGGGETDGAGSQAVAQKKARTVRAYVPACEGNWPDSPDSAGTLCPRATTLCAATTDPNDLGYWVFTSQAGAPPTVRSSWQATGEFECRGVGDPADLAVVEPVVTAEDFRRLPIPAAKVEVQPPNRRTLINIPTNLYADANPVVLPTTVLGQAVRVRATPLNFRWTYGDGSVLTTANPGAPYPDLTTAHTYRRPGTRTLGLSTTYSGEYSVGGGEWLPIDGVATVNSPNSTLTVLSAQNRLVEDPL